MAPVTLAVVGGGNRGTAYSNWALAHPDRARVVAVAEPREIRRDRMSDAHGVARENRYADWRDLAARGRVADAVLICTQDAMHLEPALAFADLGYHILLEKPLAPTEPECRQIIEAVEKAGVMLAVGHVLRYTPYTNVVTDVVRSGRLGELISIQHLEPVGYWHQAHSYVRGNWRNTAASTFMLMSKSCHDIDWIQYVMGRPITRVSSFGNLAHFRRENQPAGAADRCLDCAVERDCPYSAKRFYFGQLRAGNHEWPLPVLVDDFTEEALTEALRTGPYGRCVYTCDNDVVDHQVVSLEFADGATGTFTMTAFDQVRHRQTEIFGSRGRLTGDGELVRVYDFLTDTEETIDARATGDATAGGGHGGGDFGLMHAFVTALASGDAATIRSGPGESLTSHLAVFAAERARLGGSVEPVVR